MLNNKYFVSYGSINQNTNILQQGYYKIPVFINLIYDEKSSTFYVCYRYAHCL